MPRQISLNTSLLVATSVWATAPSAQLSESSCLHTCEEFAARIGVEFSNSQAQVRKVRLPSGSFSWRVMYGESMYVVDDGLGYVKGYFDGSRTRQIRNKLSREAAVTITSIEQAWLRANSLRTSLGLQHELLEPWKARIVPDTDSYSPDERGRATLEFQARPFGIDTFGCGNRLTMVIDIRGGGLVSLVLTKGWRYELPTEYISPMTAVSKARELAATFAPARMNTVAVLVKQFVVPNIGFGSTRAMQFRSSRVCRLAYCVSLDDFMVQIDCQTGESLGGAVRGGITRAGGSSPSAIGKATANEWLKAFSMPTIERWQRSAIELRGGGKQCQVYLVTSEGTSELSVDVKTRKVTYGRIVWKALMPGAPLTTKQAVEARLRPVGKSLGFGGKPRIEASFRDAVQPAVPKWATGKIIRANLLPMRSIRNSYAGAKLLLHAKTGQILSWEATVKR